MSRGSTSQVSHNSVDDLVSHLGELRSRNSPVVAAIDGCGGAGKSSLARAIVAALLHSAHIEHDWFHLPKNQVSAGRRFDHQRLISEVITPSRSGSRALSFLRYNWGYLAGIPDGFHETPIEIKDAEVLIIEGCETLHSSLVQHLDFRIWLDTDPEVAMQQGVGRDIHEYKLDPDRVLAAWKEWGVWEARSLALDDRRKRADVLFVPGMTSEPTE
jgi:uridine kinase